MPFKWRGRFHCFFCGKNYNEYEYFKKHTLSHGICSTNDYALKIVKGSFIEIKVDVSEINCEICSEPFHKLEEVIDHLVGKHSLDYDKSIEIPYQPYRLIDYRCLYCDQQFSYFGHVVNHVNIVHPQNTFVCDECGVCFNKKRDLGFHIRNNHKHGGYPCDQCEQIFESKYLLKVHANNYHLRKCNTCGQFFVSYSLLQKHIKNEHPESEDMNCIHCMKEFHTKGGLKQHVNRCKEKTVLEVPSNATEILPEPKKKKNVKQIRKNIQIVLNMSNATPFKFFAKFGCFYCARKFEDFEEVKVHTIAEHPVCDVKSKSMMKCKGERTSIKVDITNLMCKVCCQPIANIDELIDHLNRKHNAGYDESVTGCLDAYKVVKDNIPCPVCGKVFRYFSIVLRHINLEHNNNNRICDFCGRSFRSVANLNVHISYAHKGSSDCEHCGIKFKNQWCLARHKAKSHDAKDHKCTKCPEQFESHYQRQKHLIKVHGIGHKCSYCGKMFTRNSFMKDHIRRTHLKEKNVPCSVCNDRFFDNHLLRMHMVKHKGERKFSCDVCGKAFLRRSNLSSHMEMHKKYGHVPAQI